MAKTVLTEQGVTNPLILGSSLFPSPAVLVQSIEAAQCQVVTVSLKRQAPGELSDNGFFEMLQSLNCRLLPNTAGCRTATEAITMAQLARECFNTHWIKLEVIGDDYNLQPDPFELVVAAKELVSQGFEVFPYCTEDYVLCARLHEQGCRVLMPWAAPIGSGQGPVNPYGLQVLRQRFPETTLIVDAGIGTPQHALEVMAMGYDAVLLNSAVALAQCPVEMAKAFHHAVLAGQIAASAGPMPKREMASPSTVLVDTPFWHQNQQEESLS